MSNYPDNLSSGYDDTSPVKCFDCGHKWSADVYIDLGSAWLKNPDDVCPECGSSNWHFE